jgi:hypothetical protein
MATKYLYIDDDTQDSLDSYIQAVKGETDTIDIDAKRPKDFGNDIVRLIETLSSYDGLILDWRLDIVPDESGRYFPFRAGAIAQEIRTRQTEKNIKEFPIVLWSTYQKLVGSYYGDATSHDLFDARHDKDKVIGESDLVRGELISLAEGYKAIATLIDSQGSIFISVLGLEQDDYNLLPSRFTSYFSQNNRLQIHEYARLILKDMIRVPGPLISEELFAARLGIDRQPSSDWPALLRQLPASAKYKGPFHEAWPRWWAHLVEKKWWRSLDAELPPLSVLSASERVAKLKEFTGLKSLVAAKPIKDFYGEHFQTICEYSRRPLDPVDGVIIDEKDPLPWQERRYLSIDAALERKGSKDGLRPHPTEVERLREIKKSRSEDAETEHQ